MIRTRISAAAAGHPASTRKKIRYLVINPNVGIVAHLTVAAARCNLRLLGLRGQPFDADLRDAVPVHLEDRVLATGGFDRIARLRNVAQAHEQEPGQRLESGVAWDLDAVE